MAKYNSLPAPPVDNSPQGIITAQQAPVKWAALHQPGVGLNDESNRFLKAVELGFVPDTVDGFRTFIGWTTQASPVIADAGLYDWLAFQYRYASKVPASSIAESIRNWVSRGHPEARLQSAFTSIYGESLTPAALETIKLPNGQFVKRSDVVSDQPGPNGCRTVKYYTYNKDGSRGPVTTVSDCAPAIQESRILDLIASYDPIRYGSGDDRINVIGWRVRTLDRIRGTLISKTGVYRWAGGLYPTSILNLQDRTEGKLGITSTNNNVLSADLAAGFQAATTTEAPPAEFGLGSGGARPEPVTGGGTPATAEPGPTVGPNDLNLSSPSAGPTGGGSTAPRPDGGGTPVNQGPGTGLAGPGNDSGTEEGGLGVPTWLLVSGGVLALIALYQLAKKGV